MASFICTPAFFVERCRFPNVGSRTASQFGTLRFSCFSNPRAQLNHEQKSGNASANGSANGTANNSAKQGTKRSEDESTRLPQEKHPASAWSLSGQLSADGDEDRLRNEHLTAYFQSTDTTYQPSLAALPRLALQNFIVEIGELISAGRRLVGIDPPVEYTPPNILGLRLSDEAVANREREREYAEGQSSAAPFVRWVYDVTCLLLDYQFQGRPIQRFWFLETVARMPYFVYTSCLHLYATLGWYRSPTMMNMHHAEELNEAYHLSVMESLGGDKSWLDRFLAYHTSLFYYWFLLFLFLVSPTQSYRFSELLELHAVDTYTEFLESNEATLRKLPAPAVAQDYYSNFLYYFYEFQSIRDADAEELRPRPKIESLYDVFENIVRDEKEHSRTMTACSGFAEKQEPVYYNGKTVSATTRVERQIPLRERQQFWKKWAELSKHEGSDVQ